MKNSFLLLYLCAFTIALNAQTSYQFNEVNHIVDQQVRYKLYPTFNMWTYLKLDTKTGIITQVQFSIRGNQMEVPLGYPSKSTNGTSTNGRFELYPTSNNWTFLLIDQIDGDTYQVQWDQEVQYRKLIKIEYEPLQ